MSIIFLPLFLLAFYLAIFFAWFIPGMTILHKENISFPHKTVVASILGLVLWAWQGYLFGYLHIRWASYLYLLLTCFFFIRYRVYRVISLRKITWQKKDVFAVLMILIGATVQTLPYIRSGFMTSQGMLFTVYNQTDHYWHASMINELVQRFPPFEPGMFGILKYNYHYWFNLTTAELVRVFHLPLLPTQFPGMYVFGSISLGLMLLVLGRSVFPSSSFSYWLLFFFYFGGDASYWITFIMQKKIDFGVPSLIEDGAFFMDNPPRAFSIIIALAVIYVLFLYQKKELHNPWLLAILFGTLIGFKVYTGIAFLAGFGLFAWYHLFIHKRLQPFLLFLFACMLSACIFLPVNAKSGGLFFLPFDKVRDFITYKPLGFYDWELRWIVYYDHHNVLRLLQLGLSMTVLYLIAQFSIKVIGIFPYKKTITFLQKEVVFFCYGIVVFSLLLGMFISQKANFAESYNFFLPASIILSILTSLSLAFFLKDKSRVVQISVALIIVIIIIPRWLYRVHFTFSHTTSFSGISNDELASYTFLCEHTPGNSLVLVLNKGYEDQQAAVVSIFSNRPMYLSGQAVISAHNTTNAQRENVVKEIYENSNPQKVSELLRKNHIAYLYFYPSSHVQVPLSKLPLKTVYKSPAATIMQVSTR